MSKVTTSTETVDTPETTPKTYLVIRIPVPSKKTLAVAGASITATAVVVATVLKLRSSGTDDSEGYVVFVADDDSSETTDD